MSKMMYYNDKYQLLPVSPSYRSKPSVNLFDFN